MKKKTKKRIDYRPFHVLAELFRRGVVSREQFILEWGLNQQDQGITPGGTP
jgi:hypothetical protein